MQTPWQNLDILRFELGVIEMDAKVPKYIVGKSKQVGQFEQCLERGVCQAWSLPATHPTAGRAGWVRTGATPVKFGQIRKWDLGSN